MAKIVTRPSATVRPTVASMPRIGLGRSARIVPSWRFGSTGCGYRCGASRPLSRISRSTRRIEAHLAHPQPRPHLAVAFAMEGRFLDGAPDLGEQFLVTVAGLWAAPGGRPRAEGPPTPLVERRP